MNDDLTKKKNYVFVECIVQQAVNQHPQCQGQHLMSVVPATGQCLAPATISAKPERNGVKRKLGEVDGDAKEVPEPS